MEDLSKIFMDRRERIKYLQIQNSRKILLNRMSGNLDEITLDDFISLESTKELQRKTFILMEKFERIGRDEILPLQISYEEVVKENSDILERNREQKVVFYHRQAMSIGAIEISIDSILKNLDFFIAESEMGNCGCRVLFVDKSMRFGLCLWKGEYNMTLYKW